MTEAYRNRKEEKRMKRRIALLLAVLMTIQLTAAVPALAANPTITVTFLDENGDPIGAGKYSYEGTQFDMSNLAAQLSSYSLSATELKALGSASEVRLETSYTTPEGPEIIANGNADGKPLTVQVKGDASRIRVEDGANVTFVGDFDAPDSAAYAAIGTVGDATVSVTGSVKNHPYYGISSVNKADSSGEEIPNEAHITMVGDVKGREAAVYAEGGAEIKIEGKTVNGHQNGILAEENAKVTATVEDAVYGVKGVHARDNAVVQVEGDVWSESAIEKKDEYGNPVMDENGKPVYEANGTAVLAEDSSKVKVDGKMSGSQNGIIALDSSEVAVKGSVNSSNGTAVIAEDSSRVTVDGPVTGSGNGIRAADSAEVKVSGAVTGSNNAAVWAKDSAVVNVTGPVTSNGSAAVAATNGTDSSGNEIRNDVQIKVEGDVRGYSNGIDARGGAVIEVAGNVSGGHMQTSVWTDEGGNTKESTYPSGYGIYAEDEANIKVAQNVHGASGAIIARDNSNIQVEGSASSYVNGISAEGEAVVRVDGKVKAGHDETQKYISFDGTEKEQTVHIGSGIRAADAAKVTAGSVTASQEAVYAEGSAGVTVLGNAESRNFGIHAVDQAGVHVDGSLKSQGTGIIAAGNAQVEVDGTVQAGHVGESSYTSEDGETVTYPTYLGQGIQASDEAKVTVGELHSASSAIIVTGSADIHVQGNAESLGGEGITAHNSAQFDAETGQFVSSMTDAKVQVDGDLTSANTAVNAQGQSSIAVDGNVTSLNGRAVRAYQEATVTIGKDVEGTSQNLDFNTAAVEITGGADVTVGGSVHSSKGDAVWIETQPVSNPETNEVQDPEAPASITVGGDVTADDGAAIHMASNANVVVKGNVTGGQLTATVDYDDMTEEQAAKNPLYQARKKAQAEAFSDLDVVEEKHGAVEIESQQEGTGKLIIHGTVSANGSDIPLVVKVSAGQDELPDKPIELSLPEMKIYELTPNADGTYFDVDVTLGRAFEYSVELDGETQHFDGYANEHIAISEKEHAALVETIASAVQYIIKVDPAYQKGIKIPKKFYDPENDLYAAHEGEKVSVKFKLDRNKYDLSASGNYSLKDNGDGTWTLKVKRGGGVTLTAVIRQQDIQKMAEQSSSGERKHPAVGKSVLFGRYDLDGNGEKEELSWQILQISGRYAQLAMNAGFDEIPEDFDTAFSEWETEQIREGSLQPLSAARANKLFGDGKVHASMYVVFDALKLD